MSREIPQYDVAPDGRFLLVSAPGDEIPPSIHVMLNWNGDSLKQNSPERVGSSDFAQKRGR